MKIALLIFSTLLIYQAYSQGATCETAVNFCTDQTYVFQTNQGNSWNNQDIYGNDFPMMYPNTCLWSTENSNWFYMKILNPGVISLLAGSKDDISIIAFGPFSGAQDFGGINAGGTFGGADAFEQVKTHCSVLERQHVVDCGSNPMYQNFEPIHLPYAHSGNFYFINILNSNPDLSLNGEISLVKTGGEGTSFCDDFVCHNSCATCFGPLNNQCTDCPDSALFDTHHRLGHAGYDGTCPCDDGYVDNGSQNCDIDVCTLRMMSAFFDRNVLTLGFALKHQYHCAELTSIFPAAGLTIFGDMTCDDECDCTNYPHVVTCDISDRNYGPCQSNLGLIGACAHDDGPCTPTFGQKVHLLDFPPRITSMDIHGDDVAGGATLTLAGYWFPNCDWLVQDVWVNVGFANAAIISCTKEINSIDDVIVVTVPAMSADDVAGYPVYVMLGEDRCPHFGDYPDRNGDLGDGVSSHVAQNSDFIYGTEVTWATPNNTLPTQRTDFHLISYSWENPRISCGEHRFTFAFTNADAVDVNDAVVTITNANPASSIDFACANANCDCSGFPFLMECTEPNNNIANGRWDFTCGGGAVSCGVSVFLVPHDLVPEIWMLEENEDNVNGDADYYASFLFVNSYGGPQETYTRYITMGSTYVGNINIGDYSQPEICQFQVDFPALPDMYMEGNPIWIECHADLVSHFGNYPNSNDGVSSHATRVGQFRYGDPMDHTLDAGWSSPNTSNTSPNAPNAWNGEYTNQLSTTILIFNIIVLVLPFVIMAI